MAPPGRHVQLLALPPPLLPPARLRGDLRVLDALCGLARPADREPHDQRRDRRDDLAALLGLSAVYLRGQHRRLVVHVAGDLRHRSHRPSACSTAMRAKIFAHLQRLGLDYYDREMGGRILTRMTSDVDTLSQLLQSGLVNAARQRRRASSASAQSLVLMSRQLALVVLLRHPAAGRWAPTSTGGSSRAPTTASATRIAAVNADLQENVSGVRVTQAFRREDANTENFQLLTAPVPRRRRALAVVRRSSTSPTPSPDRQHRHPRSSLGFGARLDRRRHAQRGRLVAFLLYLDPVLRADPAALAGLRHLPAGLGRPAPHRRAARARRHVDPRRPAHPAAAGATAPARSTSTASTSRYPRQQRGGARGRRPGYRGRGDRGPRRRDRRRQVDGREARGPLLRPDRGRVLIDGVPTVATRPRRLPPPPRLRPPGAVPVLRHDPRQHRLRPPGRDRRRGRGGGAGGGRARLHRSLPAATSQPVRERRPLAVDRPAPAAVSGPRPARRPGDPAARRGDLESRPRQRGAGEPGDGRGRDRPHDADHRPPPADGAPRPTGSW